MRESTDDEINTAHALLKLIDSDVDRMINIINNEMKTNPEICTNFTKGVLLHLEEHRNELNVATGAVDVSDEGSTTTEEPEQSNGT